MRASDQVSYFRAQGPGKVRDERTRVLARYQQTRLPSHGYLDQRDQNPLGTQLVQGS